MIYKGSNALLRNTFPENKNSIFDDTYSNQLQYICVDKDVDNSIFDMFV